MSMQVENRGRILREHFGLAPEPGQYVIQDTFTYRKKPFLLVDLPGTYSILVHTVEEPVVRDVICFGKPDATLVVLEVLQEVTAL